MTDLLALSDVLVVGALERFCSRGLTGEQRRLAARYGLRYRAYESVHVPTGRHEHALEGAWDLIGDFTHRWDLPVDPQQWINVLDAYCRQLIETRQQHTLTALDDALTKLRIRHAV